MDLFINKFRKFLKNKCLMYDKLFIERKRGIDFKDILYFIIYTITNKCSYSQSIANLKDKNIIDFTRQAISTKRANIDSFYFENLHKDILKFIYNTKNSLFVSEKKANIYAVDGSELSFNKKLAKQGFRLTKNQTYCKASFSLLYDVDNKLAIAGSIDKKINERKSFIEHLLPHVPDNSIVLFDRGYYSDHLVKNMISKKLFFVIRMKNNDKTVQDMNRYNINDHLKLTKNKHLIRIIRYKIEDEYYYLATNIMNESIEYFIDIYHKRWTIEEYFKTIKHTLNGMNFNSTDINIIKQELYTHLILTNINKYFEWLANKYTNRKNQNPNYVINHKIALGLTGNRICFSLLYKELNTKIIRSLSVINNTLIEIKKNRKFPRIAIKCPTRWYNVGIANKKKLYPNIS